MRMPGVSSSASGTGSPSASCSRVTPRPAPACTNIWKMRVETSCMLVPSEAGKSGWLADADGGGHVGGGCGSLARILRQRPRDHTIDGHRHVGEDLGQRLWSGLHDLADEG